MKNYTISVHLLYPILSPHIFLYYLLIILAYSLHGGTGGQTDVFVHLGGGYGWVGSLDSCTNQHLIPVCFCVFRFRRCGLQFRLPDYHHYIRQCCNHRRILTVCTVPGNYCAHLFHLTTCFVSDPIRIFFCLISCIYTYKYELSYQILPGNC